MASAHEVSVIGGGYAGVLAASRIARRGGEAVQVTLFNDRPFFVPRIRLHERIALGQIAQPSLSELIHPGVVVRVGRVASLDPDAHRVQLEDGTSATFDTCIVATGSRAVPPPRADTEVLDVASYEGAVVAHARIRALPAGARVAVVGGGLTAIELASELAESHPQLRVSLVTRGELGQDTSAPGRAHLRAVLGRLGVTLHERVSVDHIDARGLHAGDAFFPADVTVWAAGFVAADLARRAGLACDEAGRVRVDDHLRSVSHPHLRAIGDAALTPDRLRMGCVTAMPMGSYVGHDVLAALAGRATRPFSFGFMCRFVSLGRRDALVSPTDRADGPTGLVIRGRTAGMMKEMICRATLWTLELERRASVYAWRAASPARCLPAPSHRALGSGA